MIWINYVHVIVANVYFPFSPIYLIIYVMMNMIYQPQKQIVHHYSNKSRQHHLSLSNYHVNHQLYKRIQYHRLKILNVSTFLFRFLNDHYCII